MMDVKIFSSEDGENEISVEDFGTFCVLSIYFVASSESVNFKANQPFYCGDYITQEGLTLHDWFVDNVAPEYTDEYFMFGDKAVSFISNNGGGDSAGLLHVGKLDLYYSDVSQDFGFIIDSDFKNGTGDVTSDCVLTSSQLVLKTAGVNAVLHTPLLKALRPSAY